MSSVVNAFLFFHMRVYEKKEEKKIVLETKI